MEHFSLSFQAGYIGDRCDNRPRPCGPGQFLSSGSGQVGSRRCLPCYCSNVINPMTGSPPECRETMLYRGEVRSTLPTTHSIWLKALCVGIGNPITLAMFFDILLASQLGCFIVGPFLPKSKAHFAQKVDPFCPKAVPFESFCCSSEATLILPRKLGSKSLKNKTAYWTAVH